MKQCIASHVPEACHGNFHRWLPAALCGLALLACASVDAQNASYSDPTSERQRSQSDAAARRQQQVEQASRDASQNQRPGQPSGSSRTAEDIRREVEARLATQNAEIAAVARAAAVERETARLGLRRAVVRNDPVAGVQYLERGAEGQQSFDRGVTLLMVAAWRGQVQLVGGLAYADRSQLRADADGNTPVMYAAASGWREIILGLGRVKGLLYEPPCNAAGWSALALAASKRYAHAVEAMLSQGANPNACADQGVPALIAAVAAGDAPSVRALLEAGADPQKTGRFGFTAEQLLAQRPAQVQVAQAAEAEVDRLRAAVEFAVWKESSGSPPPAARSPASFALPALAPSIRELLLSYFSQGRSGKDLIEAVQSGRVDAVRAALNRSGPDQATQLKRNTALVLAARRGFTGILQLLVEPRAGVPSVDSSSPLFFDAIDAAIDTGRPEVLRILLGVQGVEDRQGRLTTQLGRVAGSDSPVFEELARLLLAAGARPGTWFGKVLAEGGPGMLKVFMAAGADFRAPLKSELSDPSYREQGFNSLMKVTLNDRHGAAMVRMLIDAGMDVNARTSLGRSAIWYATKLGNDEAAEVLIKAGADVNVREEEYDSTPLMNFFSNGRIETLRLLLGAGADVNVRGKGGYTPLMYAASRKDPQSVRLLIDAGADVLAKEPDGRPIWSDDAQVMALLRGAREARLRGERPGEHAVQPLPPAMPAASVPASQPPSTARWVLTRYPNNNWADRVYFDESSVVRDRQLVRVWVLNDRQEVFKQGRGKSRLSSQEQLELNCEDYRSRRLQSYSFAKHMGKGKLVDSYLVPEPYSSDPGEDIAVVLRKVCP